MLRKHWRAMRRRSPSGIARKAGREVGQRDPATRHHEPPQQVAEQVSQSSSSGLRPVLVVPISAIQVLAISARWTTLRARARDERFEAAARAHAGGCDGGCRARRDLVAVVAPQVLRRALADQRFESAVHDGRIVRRVAGQRLLQPSQVNPVPRSARQSLAIDEQNDRIELARKARRQRHRVGPAAEERRPHALAARRHLVGQDADDLTVLHRLHQHAHPAQLGGREAQAIARRDRPRRGDAGSTCAESGTAPSSAASSLRDGTRRRTAPSLRSSPRCGGRNITGRPSAITSSTSRMSATEVHAIRSSRGRFQIHGVSSPWRPAPAIASRRVAASV